MSSNASDHTAFIRKLTEITEANMANEHFGVRELEREMGYSHSQLHRKLRSTIHKSASRFIREKRLDQAKILIESEAFTVAEIAYKVGFSSPSYFNKCFHDYFGHTPGEYKNHITRASENINNQNLDPNSKIDTSNIKKTVSNRKTIIVIGTLIIILFSFFIYRFLNVEPIKNTVKSIAVLPLTNASNDPENQYLADGIMNDISNRLSRLNKFVVKSTVSTIASKSADKNIYEIAEALDVSYILEGCLYKVDDRVRLYVRLIHTKNDRTIWSKNYEDDLSNVLSFVSEVSKQITDELEIVLTSKESDLLDKKYTLNKEAYNLYSEGRFYWQLRGEENLRKSIECYNYALDLDSNYCLPYVGLADSYAILAWFQYDPWQGNIPKSKEYIKKAFSIDKNLAEAHTTLGLIATYFDWDWKLAEKQFKRALEINPNYATAHQWYSEYLSIIGNKDKARYHIDKAIDLKPHTRMYLQVSYNTYFKLGDYINALDVTDKIFLIDGNTEHRARKKFNIFLRQKNELKAIEEHRKVIKNNLQDCDSQKLDSMLLVHGIDYIVHSKINLHSKNKIRNSYFIARYYAITGDENKALDFLTMAYEHKVPNIVQIKHELDFASLQDNPRFLDLLYKMDLGDY